MGTETEGTAGGFADAGRSFCLGKHRRSGSERPSNPLSRTCLKMRDVWGVRVLL